MTPEAKNCLSAGQYSGAIDRLKHIDGLIAGTTVYEKNAFGRDFHYHENPHLTYILQGGNIENRKGTNVELKAGDVVFYHSGEWHQTLPAAAFSKNINLEIEEVFLKTFDISESNLNEAVRQNPDSKFLLLKIYKELLTDDPLTDVSIQMLLLKIAEDSPTRHICKPRWIIKLYEILNDRWNESHNLADLSASLQVHPVTISKCFPKFFGCTLGEYVRKLKIEKSVVLMKNSRLSLTEIGAECGFSDQSHFTRNFKALTGFLPRQFKKI